MGARGHHGEGEEGSTCLPDTGAISPGLSSGEKDPLEQACLLHLSLVGTAFFPRALFWQY